MYELSYVIDGNESFVGSGYSQKELKDLAKQVVGSLKEIHYKKKITFWISLNDKIITEFTL